MFLFTARPSAISLRYLFVGAVFTAFRRKIGAALTP